MNPRRAALRALKATSAAADFLRPARRGVVVLLYHRVGRRSGLEVDLPTGLFEGQMEVLSGTRRVVGIDAALATLSVPGAPRTDDDPVVVTFDDGTTDVVEVALPILERHGMPCTLYLATDFVESQRAFPDGGRPLSWSALGDALTTGLLTVGSHTHTHTLLDRCPVSDAQAELDRSRGLIEDRLGVEALHFAYPKAVPGSPGAEAAVRARFASAALAGTRPNRYGATDPHRLARSPIQVADGMRYFRRKAAGGMAFEDAVRRVVNRGRYAGATT